MPCPPAIHAAEGEDRRTQCSVRRDSRPSLIWYRRSSQRLVVQEHGWNLKSARQSSPIWSRMPPTDEASARCIHQQCVNSRCHASVVEAEQRGLTATRKTRMMPVGTPAGRSALRQDHADGAVGLYAPQPWTVNKLPPVALKPIHRRPCTRTALDDARQGTDSGLCGSLRGTEGTAAREGRAACKARQLPEDAASVTSATAGRSIASTARTVATFRPKTPGVMPHSRTKCRLR